MNLHENYNTASQICKKTTRKLLNLGLLNEYLHTVSRFRANDKIRLETFVDLI